MIASLNEREVDGYGHVWLPVYRATKEGGRETVAERALVFVAGIRNRSFAGWRREEDVVERVLRCEGKSGKNRVYLEKLAEAAKEIGDFDEHLQKLVRLLPPAEEGRSRAK